MVTKAARTWFDRRMRPTTIHRARQRLGCAAWFASLTLLGPGCSDDSSSGSEQTGTLCTNACRFASNGVCNDGAPGADGNECELGSDCDDCGPRTASAASGSGGGSAGGGECSLTLSGATGNEPGGLIPVCCTPGGDDRALVDELLVLVNEYRAANALAPFTVDPGLEAAMQGHCLHMAEHDFFDHEAPEAAVSTPWVRAELCGSSASAENIAWGSSTAAATLDQWKGSPGHNANLLGDTSRVGICHSGDYWGMIFG